ncbi:MAG: TlpA family protein disulfide reductase [Actinomycetota bacterium]|nr:TlpA family protein disulfide reductase [Actinomycetota bacterium]
MKRLLSPLPVALLVGLLALLSLLVYGLVAGGAERRAGESSQLGEGSSAPALALPLLSGAGRGSLADYRGKVVVLNFWASWCEPCRDESPLLQRWHERISRSGGTVVGVDVLDVTGDAKAFAAKHGLGYPLLRDGDGETLKDFEVAGQPWTFVIGRDGRIAAVRRGPVDDAFMRAEVLPLTRRPS